MIVVYRDSVSSPENERSGSPNRSKGSDVTRVAHSDLDFLRELPKKQRVVGFFFFLKKKVEFKEKRI